MMEDETAPVLRHGSIPANSREPMVGSELYQTIEDIALKSAPAPAGVDAHQCTQPLKRQRAQDQRIEQEDWNSSGGTRAMGLRRQAPASQPNVLNNMETNERQDDTTLTGEDAARTMPMALKAKPSRFGAGKYRVRLTPNRVGGVDTMVILYDPKESRRFSEDAEVRGRGLGSRLLGRMQLIQQRDYGGSGTTSSKRLQPKVGAPNRCKQR
jgi:hypothetical protein